MIMNTTEELIILDESYLPEMAGIFLQTDNDKPAYRFYKKNGFEELHSHVSFYKRVNGK